MNLPQDTWGAALEEKERRNVAKSCSNCDLLDWIPYYTHITQILELPHAYLGPPASCVFSYTSVLLCCGAPREWFKQLRSGASQTTVGWLPADCLALAGLRARIATGSKVNRICATQGNEIVNMVWVLFRSHKGPPSCKLNLTPMKKFDIYIYIC